MFFVFIMEIKKLKSNENPSSKFILIINENIKVNLIYQLINLFTCLFTKLMIINNNDK